MLKQTHFESAHREQWESLRTIVDKVNSGRPGRRPSQEQLHQLPSLYVGVCNHLSLAKTRGYSPNLVNKLHNLVMDSHRLMYQRKTNWVKRAYHFIRGGFPTLVRQHYKLFWLCTALFYLPAIITGLFAYADTNFIYRIHDSSTVESMEYMYEPSESMLFRTEGRESSSDFYMFGHYISNNIGIDFRVFAAGILFGIGTLFFMIYNGLAIGSVAGHLTAKGYIPTFWGFVAGHSAFELTALVISGMSGMLIGLALISPGRRARADALKQQAQIAVRLVIGAGIMTLLAAFIEAYWSSSNLNVYLKYSVGVFFWTLTFVYLLFGKTNPTPIGPSQSRGDYGPR